MSSGLRELRVWQESVALAGDVIRAIRPGMRRETKVISESVMLTALSVGSHVADGFARPSVSEQRESYLAAKRALLRFETELAIARQAELVPAGTFTELCARTGQVTRLLTGYLVHLDRQLSEREAASANGQPGSVTTATRDSARAPS
ncbi:MAG: four helix bundle protein [Gemmatimonadaceae bacterium]